MTTKYQTPADVWPDKHPSAGLIYAVDFEPELARRWSPYTDFVDNVRIRVFVAGKCSGWEMEATSGGRTGGRMPSFPTVEGETVEDGGIVWTAREISTASLERTLNGVPAWSADAALTITSQAVSANGIQGLARIAGGIDGTDYAVTVTASTNDGEDLVKVVILPVRIPVRGCR